MGPLEGLQVVEFGGMGPGPFGAMILSDLGADVIRIDRPADVNKPVGDKFLRRGRRSIAVDLRHDQGRTIALRLVERADVLIEGFRPGVMERLRLGPDDVSQHHAGLVYARMTGWGQTGPLSARAGHDINYISVAGVLGAIGTRAGDPVPPLSLVGDFGGGGMLLAVGVLAALFSRERTGLGQVVDAAMVDGAALQVGLFLALQSEGQWVDQRESNMLDGGAYFYRAYQTSDGGYMSVGAIEPQFHEELLTTLGLNPTDFKPQHERSEWSRRAEVISDIFRCRTRDEWTETFDGTDACVSPVLSLGEVPAHSQHLARESLLNVDGIVQPRPAPRFDRTPPADPEGWAVPGAATEEILSSLGITDTEADLLHESGIVASP